MNFMGFVDITQFYQEDSDYENQESNHKGLTQALQEFFKEEPELDTCVTGGHPTKVIYKTQHFKLLMHIWCIRFRQNGSNTLLFALLIGPDRTACPMFEVFRGNAENALEARKEIWSWSERENDAPEAHKHLKYPKLCTDPRAFGEDLAAIWSLDYKCSISVYIPNHWLLWAHSVA